MAAREEPQPKGECHSATESGGRQLARVRNVDSKIARDSSSAAAGERARPKFEFSVNLRPTKQVKLALVVQNTMLFLNFTCTDFSTLFRK